MTVKLVTITGFSCAQVGAASQSRRLEAKMDRERSTHSQYSSPWL